MGRVIKLIFFFLIGSRSIYSTTWEEARKNLTDKRYRDSIENYIYLCSGNYNFNCNNELGISYLGLGNYTKAIEFFNKALSQKQEPRLMTNLARAFYLNNNIKKADEYYKKAYSLAGDDMVVGTNYAIYLLKTYNKNKAHQILLSMVNKYPGNFYVRLYLGISYYLKRDYSRSERNLSAGIRLNNKYSDLYYHRSLIYYVRRDYGKALSDLKKAQKLSPIEPKLRRLIEIIKKKKKY